MESLGGVLSPLPFIVFIHEFFNLPIKSSPFSFSDNIDMFKYSGIVTDNVEHVADDLEVVSEYFLRLKKAKLVHFRKAHVKVDDLLALVINGVTIGTYVQDSQIAGRICCLGRALCEGQLHHISWQRCY